MILVYGQSGQVARELQRRAPEAIYLDRSHADLSDPKRAAMHTLEIKPEIVINAAAYTQVDRAESERPLAETVNGDAPGEIAKACAAIGAPLVHISTDYVFSGAGTSPHTPDDPTDPANAYGASKLKGEEAIRASAARHAILRTSWVFSAHGVNFVKSILRLGAERDQLTIVADQVGGPTPAAAIADACLVIAGALTGGHTGGTYHFAGSPDVSWADFAREILRQADLTSQVVDIPTSEYPTPAPRPLNSRLDCSTLEAEFGIKRPDWKAGLADVLKELRV